MSGDRRYEERQLCLDLGQEVDPDQWDLEVLGGSLLSDIAELFVATHCVKMRDGWYRFQAQFLSR